MIFVRRIRPLRTLYTKTHHTTMQIQPYNTSTTPYHRTILVPPTYAITISPMPIYQVPYKHIYRVFSIEYKYTKPYHHTTPTFFPYIYVSNRTIIPFPYSISNRTIIPYQQYIKSYQHTQVFEHASAKSDDGRAPVAQEHIYVFRAM